MAGEDWTDAELSAVVEAVVASLPGDSISDLVRALRAGPLDTRSPSSIRRRIQHVRMVQEARESGGPDAVARMTNIGRGRARQIAALLEQQDVAPEPVRDVRWFFINTDAASLGDRSPHDAWFFSGMAFTGGPRSYGERLGQFEVGDTLLMWANGLGVVGVGVVVEPWDGEGHDDNQRVYVGDHRDTEYRRRVHWYADLRAEPITRDAIGWNPVQAVQGADGFREVVQEVLAQRGLPQRPCFAPRATPDQGAFVAALRELRPRISDLQRAMLVAQYGMPGRMATSTTLADAVGQAQQGVVNLHYGRLGHLLADATGYTPYRWDGSPQWWNVLSWCPREQPAFVWQMQPPLAHALETLGWVTPADAASPDEAPDASFGFVEGSVRRVTVNAYERDPRAREACIASREQVACEVCGFDFERVYGDLGRGFIHVHHVQPVHTLGPGYVVDPVNDLALVCPNCHAMLHRESPPLGLEKLRAVLRRGLGATQQDGSSRRG